MIHFFTSSALEPLRARFEQHLRAQQPSDTPDLLRPDLVIVPNQDMSRWLQIRRAQETGISANMELLLPANYVHRLNLMVNPDYERGLPDKFRLAWRLYHILTEVEQEPEYDFLHAYIYHKGAQNTPERELRLRRFQLSSKIADIYDQYQLFRPDWILAWNRGAQPDEIASFELASWQKSLWQALRERYPEMTDRPSLHAQLLAALEQNDLALPPALHVFATGPVPPLYIETLTALGLQTEVFWYRVIPAEKEMSAAPASHPLRLQMGEEQLATHSVITAACKKIGVSQRSERITAPAAVSGSVLKRLQAGILHDESLPKHDIGPDDQSLLIHACHNPQREIEILHDNILEFLETHPDAYASDVLVVAPDLSRHVRAIHATFGTPAEEDLRLPYHIHDPSNTLTARLFDLLLGVMMIDRTRFRADEVVALIARQPIRERFGLSLDDIGLIEHWLRQTGIRWGVDAAYRKDDGVFSWEFGVQRMLMGIMQPPEQQEPVLDVAPYGDIEGAGSLRIADALLRILKRFRNWVRISRGQHTAAVWKEQLTQLLAGILPEEDSITKALMPIQRSIERLEDAGAEEPLPLDVVADSLKNHLRERTAGAGFRKGGVSFSTMVPVRHLPFRFIAVLGLNESSFPGHEPASGFDLMQHNARPGDRQRRLANRALFLDALLAAGQRLHLSYEGFDLRDGQPVPPSPVVAELRETLEPGIDEANSQLRVAHRLHGFHPEYLNAAGGESRKFTYDAFRPRLLRRLQQDTAPEPALERFDTEIPGMLEAAPGAEKAEALPERITLELDELLFFLRHPLRWAMERRLDMRQPQAENPTEGRDVFEWDALQKYTLRQELLRLLLEYQRGERTEPDEAGLRHHFRRKGLLPYRDKGDFSFAQEYRNMKQFLNQIPAEYRRRLPGAPRLASYHMRVNQADVSLQQRIHTPIAGEHVIIDHAEAKPKRIITHWLHHLFSGLTTEPEMRTRYISLIPPDKQKNGQPIFKMMVFEPDEQAAERLQELVATYLNCSELPPPFTPEALKLLHEADTAEEKDKEQKLTAFRNYFEPASFNQAKFSRVYGDDAYAALFYSGYQSGFEEPLRELKDRFWANIKLEERD